MTDFHLASLEVTVHGRQYPEAADYWDGNWLNVTAKCGGPDAYASARGPILHLSEIAHWLAALKKMSETLSGSADLETMEANLSVKMAINRLGQITLSIFITPDHLSQEHKFRLSIDQSYLAPLINQLEAVLKEFPMKGQP